MTKKQLWQSVVVLAVAVGVSVIFASYTDKAAVPGEIEIKKEAARENISLTIEGLYENKQVEIAAGESVLRVLEMLNQEDKKLGLQVKEYANLGVLVEAMGGVKNGADNKYWQYEVNGVMPQIGADRYKLAGGEFVRWFFAESRF